MEYLIVVDYLSDAERKRIDYAIERWQEKASVQKPRGTVILFRDGDVDAFLDNLYSRLSLGKDAVRVFAGGVYSPEIAERTVHLKYDTEIEPVSVEKFINYVMRKMGASFEGIRNGIKCYMAYTKKGQVSIAIVINDAENKAVIKITVSGYGDAVAFVRERIDKEMTAFLET